MTESVYDELTRHMRLLGNPRCTCLHCRAAHEITNLERQIRTLHDALTDEHAAGAEVVRLTRLTEWQQGYIQELTNKLEATR